MENDVPYFVESRHGRLVELPVQWFLDDVPYYVFLPVMGRRGRLPGVEEVYENWAAEFDGAYRFGRAFMLTMHPRESGRLAKIMILERLIQHMRSFPGVEFMRCVDVAQQWKEQHG